MNILNSKEAFEAMMAGRNIMCRAVGELMDFDDLSQFPATIFAMPGYEFCIKVETMELAGITFAKPLTLDDVVEDQDIYIVYPDHISHVKFSRQCSEHFACVRNGFAQLDQENAVLQLEALGELFGRVICYPPVIDNVPKTKKKRSTKAKNETEQAGIPAGPGDAVPDIEKQPEPELIQPIEAIEQEATINTETPVTGIEADSVETDRVKLVEKFTAQIDQFTKEDDVLSFRHVFLANGQLDQKDQQHLCKLTEDKLLELDPEQYTPKAEPEPIAEEVIEAQQPSMFDQIENAARKQASVESAEHGSAPIDLFYKKKKQVLINRIYDMDSVETLERLAPAIPAAKLLPSDHQELLSLYAQRKDALIQAAETGEAS
ncbi:hypothetical protein [Acinetobacter lwoffii]|uniref:hypothetical protein n=1 Tax=Acinetobacter lwoffii TaxID=28090 RepID=UPI001443A883|nr:hypothetical protein [Acinetobacter lwoffii]MCU4615619.1 hypothetical protein [Acinetobacter lwoffii]NKS45312.1 hypothetical protein [Acinetobacter lwoffii]